MAIGMKPGRSIIMATAAIGLSAVALPGAAHAQLYFLEPEFQRGPISGSDPIVGLPLPGATPNEYHAHLLWNLRAGLNVAALQCQFSPFLRSVDNYNSVIAHHSEELANAYTALNTYFKRIGGPKDGQKAFDDYTTITYNNFSTLYAQPGFCQVAADIAKEALTRPKGQFFLTAQNRMRELRSALTYAYPRRVTYNPYTVRAPVLPPLDPACYDKKNRLRKKCATALYAATR